MMDALLQWDTSVMHWINNGWTNPVFDMVMPFMRNKYTWIPLYVLCIAWIFYNLPIKKSSAIILFVIVSIFASDTISSKLIKFEFKRPRPCHELQMEPPVILRVECGSGFSFTSSHAANHFCLAAFLTVLFGSVMKRWTVAWWIWALAISLAQVYVGLHYPLDITAGGVLGATIGFSMGILCKHLIHYPDIQHST